MLLSFLGRPVSLWTSLSGLPLLCSISFGLLCVHFHLFPETFWFLPWSYAIQSPWIWVFWVFSLRLVATSRPLWSKKMPDVISIFLNLMRLVLCPIMWSIRRKEGAAALSDSIDRTGEHYAKWTKPGSEGQISYDLTNQWNIINKTNKQAKYNQRHWNEEQTHSNQRGWGRG